MSTVSIQPNLLSWAVERSGLQTDRVLSRFPRFATWMEGGMQPTMRQLEDFAHFVHVPVGYLFLTQPPVEPLPLPDFRTLSSQQTARLSPNLLDTIYLCQNRQTWFIDYARTNRLPVLSFVGSATLAAAPEAVAAHIRTTLHLIEEEQHELQTWQAALSYLREKAEDAGILVMASSIVGSNSHRKLSVEEFRGFVLSDERAPLIFLNAAESKSAQIFTLAHELAHVWLGSSGLSDAEAGTESVLQTERWCNAVAAELLVPADRVTLQFRREVSLPNEVERLARVFKVSTLVVLRRLFDLGLISRAVFGTAFQAEKERMLQLEVRARSGGDFYRTLGARTGKRFARAVLVSTLEGQTLFSEAFQLLGVRKNAVFYQAAKEMGVL